MHNVNKRRTRDLISGRDFWSQNFCARYARVTVIFAPPFLKSWLRPWHGSCCRLELSAVASASSCNFVRVGRVLFVSTPGLLSSLVAVPVILVLVAILPARPSCVVK